MVNVLEEDVLGAGKNQVVMERTGVKVVIVPELGGRIADVQLGEVPFLHRTYPEGVNFGPYTEYGGVEECIGGAPGSLWNTIWKWEPSADGILLQALSKKTLVRKLIHLEEAEPIVRIDYSFINLGNAFSKFTFGIHPEVCIAGSLRENRYHVPTGGELLNGGYIEPGFKSKLLPSGGWCAISCEDLIFGQMFPEGVIDTVEVYYPKIDTHVVLEPIIFGVGVSPDKCAGFTYMMYMGDGDVEKVKEMRAARKSEFLVKYEPFDKSEIPGDVIAELDEISRAREKDELADRLAHEAAGRVILPQAPAFHPGEQFRPFPSGTGRTGDLPADTEISIEHLSGNIAIHGWENSHIEYADVRGDIRQSRGAIRFEASGEYSLKVPRSIPALAVNFVNGEVSVFDVASSIEITGVNGKVGIVSPGITDDRTLNVSLVNGDISLTVSGDCSCSISATSLSGEITCDLPLGQEQKTHNQLSGVLGDGNAEVTLSTVKGNISINRIINQGENNE